MIDDHTSLPITVFGGLLGRDSFADSVPSDHFIDALNVITNGGELKTRNGFPVATTEIANIRRFHIYKRENEADRVLVLDSTGNLYDIIVSPTPILTIAAMTDFAVCQFFDKIYISPHNGIKGLPGEFVYVYSGGGPGTVRKAGGEPTTASFTVTESATAGNIVKGDHAFGVCFVTSSGFITQPGPVTFPFYTASGGKKVDLASIPIGPAGTAQRRIVATTAIEKYNGDKESYNFFFVPGGTINNNTATTLTLDFFDSALELSADYTLDQSPTIPACVFIAPYRKRLAFGGEDKNPSMVRFSKSDEPESVDTLSGFIVFDPNETIGVKSGIEFRDNFYVMKGPTTGHTYAVSDNTFEPSTWKPIVIDRGIGCDVNGSSQFLDAKGSNADYFFVADPAGLYAFGGSFDAANPLSNKIANLWRRINKLAFNKLQLIIDPKRLLMYVLVPLDSAVTPSHLLVCNYEAGLTPDTVSWHKWTFAGGINPVCMAVQLNKTTGKTDLRIGNYAGNIYSQVDTSYDDNGESYDTYTQFALQSKEPGWIHAFNAARFRITGNGSLIITATGLDAPSIMNLPGFDLSAQPGGEKIIPFLLTNEKCSIKIRLIYYNNWMKVRKVETFGRPLWATRHG